MPGVSLSSLRRQSRPPGLAARRTSAWLVAFASAFLLCGPAAAATFKGTELTDASGTYLVTKDVIVRAEPQTKADRTGHLKQGEQVEVFGRAAGNWFAVKKGDKRLGFVYAPVLAPLIDGALTRNVNGKAAIGRGARCMFSIHFEGKSEVEGETISTADYDVAYRCESAGRKFAFNGPMFITEAPYQALAKAVYQINVDLLDIAEDPDYVFSTVLLYDAEAGEVKLEAVSPPEFAGPPTADRKAAGNVREALAGAVEIALAAWSGKVWETLAKADR